MKASERQVGGSWYSKLAIGPKEYSQKNRLGALESDVVKYVTRHKDKGGVQDIEKAIHALELLIEWEYDSHISQKEVRAEIIEREISK
jgi:hypothetical protein